MTLVQRMKVFALILGLSTFGFAGYAAAEGGQVAREIVTDIFGQIITGALEVEPSEGQDDAGLGDDEEDGADGESDWDD